MINRQPEPLPIVLGAASLGAAVYWFGRRWDSDRRAPTGPDEPPTAAVATFPPTAPPASWVYPVPTLGDRVPEVSNGWGTLYANPDHSHRPHLGADIMFRRRTRSDLIDTYRPGTPHGTGGYFMPDDVPALAVGAGLVTFAAWTARGFTVTIWHPEGWTTYYTHLSALAVTKGQTIEAGHRLGTIGGDPLDNRHLMHLHFEIWRDHKRSGAIDPGPHLRTWQHRATEPAIALRNRGAALVYRPIGAPSERYPDWLRALRGKSGVYVIRERSRDGDPVVVYVGESHTGRLYETLTRHFQTWRRAKGWWKGAYTEGHDPGLTYARERVEVAVRVLSSATALAEETRLIRRLHPRDNLIGQPEDVPF